ncbi:hypothetical protein [Roseobacter sp. HKCC-CH-9208]|uniref:hypothetical protein n=1 Tax=Roseobacter sp. HKCC-CH-9208 TaxID=3120339 RepID=UPI0030EB79B5
MLQLVGIIIIGLILFGLIYASYMYRKGFRSKAWATGLGIIGVFLGVAQINGSHFSLHNKDAAILSLGGFIPSAVLLLMAWKFFTKK